VSVMAPSGASPGSTWPGAQHHDHGGHSSEWRSWVVIVGLLALAVWASSAAPVAARHSPNALYTGTHSGGGAMEFNVSHDGALITRFKFLGVPCQDGSGTLDTEIMSSGGISIINHAFNGVVLDVAFDGSFPSTQSASGSYQHRSASPCVTPTVSWTASTTAPPPSACLDADDNDGDGKVDYPADRGCLSAADSNETDPPDNTAPAATLRGKTTQKAGRSISVGVSCPNEACTARATGSVSVPGASAARRFRLRPALAGIPAGDKATLRLRVSRPALAAIRRALRSGAQVRAKLVVMVRDGAGNRTVKRRTIRLR
jgi:hypothetical protein